MTQPNPIDYASGQASPAPKGRGVKIPAAVVTLLVLLAASGGAWFVYSQLIAGPAVDPTQYESNDSPAAAARSRFYQPPTTNPTEDVKLNADGSGQVTVNGAFCRFTKKGDTIEVTLAYRGAFGAPTFVPPDDRAAAIARGMLLLPTDMAAKAKVSPEQMEKLKALTPPVGLPATDADRQKLADQWKQYVAAADTAKPAIAEAMSSDVRRLAAAGIDGTIRAYADFAVKVKAIFTPEQLEAVRPRGGRRQPR